MARRNRNLAGLAALGALGYMATREKDIPVEDRGPSRREISLEELARGSRDLEGGITPQGLDESGQRIRELDKTPASPVAPARRRPQALLKTDEDFPPVQTRRRNVAGDYTRKMGATAEEIAAYNRSRQAPNQVAAEQPAAETSGSPAEKAKRMSPRPNTTYTHQLEAVRARKAAERAAAEQAGMKKGGAVKKMASGGFTSASKRADGIASRGKTKCKMY